MLLLSVLVSAQDRNQYITAVDSFRVNLENEYNLRSTNILPFSEAILVGEKILTRYQYSIDYRLAKFSINDSVFYSINDTIVVTYQTMLIGLKKEYKRRSLVVSFDNRFSDSIRVVRNEKTPLTAESIFGSDIRRSGSIIRGFTVGTNKDFTVNSGLRLQLSGKLSDEISIVAALTDENTPIQPEGNTERLEELDKVFIETTHPNATGTFGDFDLVKSNGEFGKLNRKLQGLKGDFRYDNYNGGIAFASSRGKFNSNQMSGEDGSQGPYRLTGSNNEREIIIIAGSESVYIDGEEMKRGENNDYTIEYAGAEITFTPNRLITSASRITVDFEYTDRQFQRNFVGANLGGSLFDNKLKFGFNFFREADDENNPIDITISDEEKKILAAAGDDRELAVRDGAVLAAPDSLGRIIGTYTKIDTVISGEDYSYYLYNPGDDNSLYNVVFSYVGSGSGDYSKISTGKYEFVGIGNGAYLPIKYLPLAASRQAGNFVVAGEPLKGLTMSLELAGSIWDKNKMSALDDDDNSGFARSLSLGFSRNNLNIGLGNIHQVSIGIKDRFVDSRFTSLDRFNSVEFERDYNTGSTNSGDEILREATIDLSPVEQINLSTTYGYLKQGNSFSSDRYLAILNIDDYYNIRSNYKFDYVKSVSPLLSSKWNKQQGNLNYSFGTLSPGIEFLYEDKQDVNNNSDSLLAGSLRYSEMVPVLSILNFGGFNASVKYSLREEFSPLEGSLEKESLSKTKSFSLSYKGIKDVSSEMSVVLRNKEFTTKFRELGELDNETVLIRSQNRFNFWQRFVDGDLFYEASTQRTARLEKVFIRVTQGTGNYIYLGDLNENGIADEEEFEPTVYEGDYVLTTLPTDELFPVVDLKLNTRWRLNFDKFVKGNLWYETILKPLSTETTYRIEEKSKETDTKQIYLLNFNRFLNDSTTIRGFNLFQQDVNLFRNNSELSIRLRFTERDNLNLYSSGLEKGYLNERSVRIKFRMIKEINNQTDYISRYENVSAPVSLNRSRIVSEQELSSDFSYRPYQHIECGFKFTVGNTMDRFPEKPTEISSNAQLLRFTLSFAGRGRLRVEGERDELIAKNADNTIPYEITQGKVIGKNYLWRVNFDYRLSTNLQTTIAYSGRKQGAGSVIHTMRAEARAFF